MNRREERRKDRRLEALVKGIGGLILLISLAIGGIKGFVPVLLTILFGAVILAVIGGLLYFFISHYRRNPKPHHGWADMLPIKPGEAFCSSPASTPAPSPPSPAWTSGKIEGALGEIDWYQFEKFCAALLRNEGFTVERKGGAQPDGGVDLVATKNGESMLVQCKHWKTWTVQEKVIRELLGSMTHYQVKRGALYVLKGATRPAEAFATHHGIDIVTGQALSSRARDRLADCELTSLLSSREHHCPKCESPMVWRTGDFTPFWGCSTYPRCRGILKHSGAR